MKQVIVKGAAKLFPGFFPLLLFAVFFILNITQVYGQQAVIRELAGTVEFKRAGAAVWEKAERGQTLQTDTLISTGFRSTALIALGNSLLTVKPLTRLSLIELSRLNDTEKTTLNLQIGRVRAEINPLAGGRVDFSVRSSAATASVRGTVFEFDTLYLLVIEGTVEFAGYLDAPLLVDAGGSGIVDEDLGRSTLSGPSGGPDASTGAAPGESLWPRLPIAAETVKPEAQYTDLTTPFGMPEAPPVSQRYPLEFSAIDWLVP